ncbi:sigma-70 family RNA polymerase sigma factor [Streptomyces ossamyceticus]|nr:sigma-70 family RNA polymerase sigma factor [Streptomyces ossamyceticus]
MTPEHQESPVEASYPPDTDADDAEPATAAEFIENNREHLVGFAARICGSRETAEDVVQDLYPALEKHWHRIENPAPWARRAVFNKLIRVMQIRQREISTENLPEDDGYPFRNDEATPHDAFAAKELLQEIRLLLADLPYEKRMILIMSANRVPQEEIAVQLGMSRGAVRTALGRIKNDLARCLGVPEQRVRRTKRSAQSNNEKETDA